MITDKIKGIIEPSTNSLGYEIIQIKYYGDKKKTLEIMIERADEEGVTIQDCVAVTKHVSVLLDVEDPISGEYNLEVTSAGVNRPLFNQKDYSRFIGSNVKIKLLDLIDGHEQKILRGIIKNVTNDNVTIAKKQTEAELLVAFDNIRGCNLDVLDN